VNSHFSGSGLPTALSLNLVRACRSLVRPSYGVIHSQHNPQLFIIRFVILFLEIRSKSPLSLMSLFGGWMVKLIDVSIIVLVLFVLIHSI
jgi:hypothetical protein